MPLLVTAGAMCSCTFGAAPSALNITPESKAMGCSKPAGNILDNKPNVNIMPFGMCSNPANPQVAAATAAALGVLTPQPCMPVTAAPWMPGCPTVLVGNKPALTDSCKLMCSWGGVISVTNPGQGTIKLP